MIDGGNMNAKSPEASEKYDEIFEKILASLQSIAPKAKKEVLNRIALKRTRIWIDFVSNEEEGLPLFSLFRDVDEISNLKIEGVRVEYPIEPLIVLECDYKGTKRRSHLTFDEASEESEFAKRYNVKGWERFLDTVERLEMEMIDTRKVRKVGNSLVVTIPESISNLFNLKDGDYFSFIYRFGEVKVKKATPEIQ
jgi:hypothetical protein